MAEQQYKAVQAVLAEGKTVTEVAAEGRVSRQTVHSWLARSDIRRLQARRRHSGAVTRAERLPSTTRHRYRSLAPAVASAALSVARLHTGDYFATGVRHVATERIIWMAGHGPGFWRDRQALDAHMRV